MTESERKRKKKIDILSYCFDLIYLMSMVQEGEEELNRSISVHEEIVVIDYSNIDCIN